MKFGLKKPCKKCPFRTDIDPYLRSARVEEILDSLIDGQGTFACHETTEFDDDGESVIGGLREQHCAGALILLEKIERPNQLMRIYERLGGYDMRALDMDAPVFDSAEILSVGLQGREIHVWALVDDTEAPVPRHFYVQGTGQPCLQDGKFIGTVFIEHFVWHVFDGGELKEHGNVST